MQRNLLLLTLLVLSVSTLTAQLDRGSITGAASDSTGALIPGVQVTVLNTATGAVYRTTTTEAGQYTMPNLPVGPYQITFEAPNFKKFVRSGVTLGATQVLRVDATLEVGAVIESVEVTAEVVRLQTDSPEVGTSLSNRQLLDLPLSFSGARAAETFAYKLSPGVSGSSWESNVNGSTGMSKETVLDGATVTTERSGHFGESSVSIESLQELKIQTSGISAEFGRTQAGVFNYVMRSGANQIHGSAYGALRNEALNANTFVNNSKKQKRNLDRKQNYAGSFGGPIYLPHLYDGRNRTFFYATYERYRERTGGFGAPSLTEPLPEFYDGNFSRLLGAATGQSDALGRAVLKGAIYDPTTFRQLPSGQWIGDMFLGNQIPSTMFSAVSRNVNTIAKAGYLPTVRDASGQIPLANNAAFPLSGSPTFDQYQFSVKLDQNIDDRNKLSGSYSYNARPMNKFDVQSIWNPAEPDGGPLSAARYQRLRTVYVRLAHNAMISPNVLNYFNVHYNRTINPIGNVHKEINGASELGITGIKTNGYPTINWGSGPYVTLSNPGHDLSKFFGLVGWGFLNTLSATKGRHFMKAGFDFRRNHVNSRWGPQTTINFNPRATAIPNAAFAGTSTGYGFASYLLGLVDNAVRTEPIPLGARMHYYGMFFQDDFRVSAKLTLNLGLRWEYQPPHTEAANRLSSWNPLKTDPISGRLGAYDFAGNCSGCTGKSYFGKAHPMRDFGPRFGFAFQPVSRWTIRGAYGITYEADMTNGVLGSPLGQQTSVAWYPTWRLSADAVEPWRGIFNWDSGFPANRYVPGSFDASWGNANRPGMIDPAYGASPLVQQWNLNIQREVLKNLIVDVGYIGNQGSGLHAGQLAAVNQISPALLSQFGTKLNNPVRNATEAAANGIAYPFPGFAGTVASALRPYPQVQGNNTVDVYGSPLGFSTYHALAITVNRQLSHGLSAYVNYVWSKNMSNVQSSEPASNTGRPLDYYNLALEKAVSNNDIPRMFKAFVNYELPFGKGKGLWSSAGKAADAIVGGWSVSAILNYFDGRPMGFTGSLPLSGGWNGTVGRANIAAGDMLASDFKKSAFELSTGSSPVNTYLNKALFSNPAPLTLGTSAFRYTQARNFGTINEDFGFQKNGRIGERYRLQLRVELLNAFNRHTLGGINTNVTNVLFGQVTSVSGNRQMQAGLRLDF